MSVRSLGKVLLFVASVLGHFVPTGKIRSAIPDSSLYQNFQTYMRFAFAAGCNETIFDQVFPLGSDWDVMHPTKLITSVYAPNTTGAGYIAINDDLQAVIVSFRGTATQKLWIEDFEFWGDQAVIVPVPPEFLTREELISSEGKNILIHSGFQRIYLDHLRNLIQSPLYETARAYPAYKIVFTGHSLGAALTQLAAVDFCKNSGLNATDRIYVYSYASPRVGNGAWANLVDSLPFAKNSYRLVRYGDFVPHLPPEFLSYRHSFQQYSIFPNNQVILCNQYEKNSDECIYNDYWDLKRNIEKNQHDGASYLGYFNQTFQCHYS